MTGNIISEEIFEKVQDEKERRALLKGNLVGDRINIPINTLFSGKVFCGNCGNIFKRRQWNSNNVSKKVVWQLFKNSILPISKGYKVFFVGRTMCY